MARDARLRLGLMVRLLLVTTKTIGALDLGPALVWLVTTGAILMARLVVECRFSCAFVAARTSRRTFRSEFFARRGVGTMACHAPGAECIVRILSVLVRMATGT